MKKKLKMGSLYQKCIYISTIIGPKYDESKDLGKICDEAGKKPGNPGIKYKSQNIRVNNAFIEPEYYHILIM